MLLATAHITTAMNETVMTLATQSMTPEVTIIHFFPLHNQVAFHNYYKIAQYGLVYR